MGPSNMKLFAQPHKVGIKQYHKLAVQRDDVTNLTEIFSSAYWKGSSPNTLNIVI